MYVDCNNVNVHLESVGDLEGRNKTVNVMV